MNKYLIHTVAFSISCLIAIISVTNDFEKDIDTIFDTLRFLLPAVILISVLFWGVLLKNISMESAIVLAFSLPFYILVVNWLAIFSLTDFRAHYRPIIFLLCAIYIISYFYVLFFDKTLHNKSMKKINGYFSIRR